jgi:hypothetical protein
MGFLAIDEANTRKIMIKNIWLKGPKAKYYRYIKLAN